MEFEIQDYCLVSNIESSIAMGNMGTETGVDFEKAPLFEIKYHRGIGLLMEIAVAVLFLAYIIVGLFAVRSFILDLFMIPFIFGMFNLLYFYFKSPNIKIFSNRIEVGRNIYKINEVEFEVKNSIKYWMSFGQFRFKGEVVSKFIVSSIFCPWLTGIEQYKFKNYIDDLRCGKVPSCRFDFEKELHEDQMLLLKLFVLLCFVLSPFIFLFLMFFKI